MLLISLIYHSAGGTNFQVAREVQGCGWGTKRFIEDSKANVMYYFKRCEGEK